MVQSIETPTANGRPLRGQATALASLLGAGALLGLSTNLAKVANGAGLQPLPFLTWSLAGATLLLTIFAAARGQTPRLSRRSAEYFVVAAFLSVAGSNLILYHAVQRVGVGFVALMFSLPPLLTYAGALALRMESFCVWRAAAVTLALAGTAVLVLGKWSTPDANHFWLALTLLGPVLLAAGNLYRTRRWPPGASAESLAPGMLIAATALLMIISQFLPGASLELPAGNGAARGLVALQSLLFAGQFLLLFILQKVGGPVFLSLIGAVSAVVGVPIAMLVLAEPALPAMLPGAVLIAAGVAGMVFSARTCRPVAQRREGSS